MEIFLRNLKNVTNGLRGTVCRQKMDIFLRKLKNATSSLRGTVYTKCVYIVPVTVVDGDFP